MNLKTIACLILLSSACMAQDATEKPVAKMDVQPKLRAELSDFAPYIGSWVIDTKFKDGQPLRARKQYEIGLNGEFVLVELFAKNEDGKEYQQSHAVWRWDQKSKKVVGHRFKDDGMYDRGELAKKTGDGGKPAITAVWASEKSPVAVAQTMELIDPKSYRWKVSTSVTKENPIMEGVWRKQ